MGRIVIIVLAIIALGFGVYFLTSYLVGPGTTTQAFASNLNGTADLHPNDYKYLKDTKLAPTKYTPSNYKPPAYDPFLHSDENVSYEEELKNITEKTANNQPTATLAVRKLNNKILDPLSGTTETIFVFDGSSSRDKETNVTKLQVRFDFENDGVWDTYFSQIKSARHQYKLPGKYQVKLEVLDGGGSTHQDTKIVTVVENSAPLAGLEVPVTSGTQKTVFKFITKESTDSQQTRSSLQYRFDWNNDDQWDTQYESKTTWQHRYNKPGNYIVAMEVKDADGATSVLTTEITVTKNTPPIASFVVKTKTNGEKLQYTFDASASSDAETPLKKLRFRWDFNYTGENDIVFDSQYSTSSRHTGYYKNPEGKVIRLQVLDEEGEMDEVFSNL